MPFYEDTHLTLTKFTQNYLGKEKISISAENINLIIERTKMDRMNLKIELDKIISFSHNKKIRLPDNRLLIGSYHCSRYNTNTKRLTNEMFEAVINELKY